MSLRRPTFFAVAALLTLTIVLLLRPSFAPNNWNLPSLSSSSSSSSSIGTPSFCGVYECGQTLHSWIEEEERRYAEALEGREELIKAWGPTEDKVDSFPTRALPYTLWDFYVPAFQCPHRVERIGQRGDGGKWVCGIDRVARQDKCVIYSFGVNDDSSYESTLLKRAPGCEIWGYDYSVHGWGRQINDDPDLSKRAHFQPWALGGTDNHTDQDFFKYWKLDSLMKHNGHTFIDILKIDVEGAEFDALAAFFKAFADEDVLPIGQLQLEIHASANRANFEYFNRWWAALEAAGLRPFYNDPNLVSVNLSHRSHPEVIEYSFMNIRGNHAIVSDRYNK
ncbi:methyltransferase domain-containing protein [Lactifluus volemus]|nr:methyltransferase domain-containing protein [Lactifluus volemus]